jgi:hypothetical protein
MTMTTTISRVHVAPTLATMQQIYRLSRDGGPRSERFQAYVARVEHAWGLVAFNPMAGSAALDGVEALLALDAEAVVRQAADAVAHACAYDEPITLALVLASPGLWTDRLATEVEYRTTQPRRAGHGLVYCWSKEPATIEALRREAAAEAVRVMWTALHGAATTLPAVLAREGLAYAMAPGDADAMDPAGSPDERAVLDALDVLGDSAVMSDVAGVLYGDPTSVALGWPALGVPDRAGPRWAIARAAAIVRRVGAAAALRGTPSAFCKA